MPPLAPPPAGRYSTPVNGSGTVQEFIAKVVAWVIAVDPATLKWSAAVLLAEVGGSA